MNHHPPQEYAFTNLTVACRGNIEVLARQHAKNLRMVDSHLLEKVSYSERRKSPTVSGQPQKYSEDYIEIPDSIKRRDKRRVRENTPII